MPHGDHSAKWKNNTFSTYRSLHLSHLYPSIDPLIYICLYLLVCLSIYILLPSTYFHRYNYRLSLCLSLSLSLSLCLSLAPSIRMQCSISLFSRSLSTLSFGILRIALYFCISLSQSRLPPLLSSALFLSLSALVVLLVFFPLLLSFTLVSSRIFSPRSSLIYIIDRPVYSLVHSLLSPSFSDLPSLPLVFILGALLDSCIDDQ